MTVSNINILENNINYTPPQKNCLSILPIDIVEIIVSFGFSITTAIQVNKEWNVKLIEGFRESAKRNLSDSVKFLSENLDQGNHSDVIKILETFENNFNVQLLTCVKLKDICDSAASTHIFFIHTLSILKVEEVHRLRLSANNKGYLFDEVFEMAEISIDLKKAEAICSLSIVQRDERTGILVNALQRCLKIGRIKKAITIANKMFGPENEIAFTAITKELIEIGNIDKATEITTEIRDVITRADVLLRIGNADKAIEVVNTLPEILVRGIYDRSQGLDYLCLKLIEMGNIERAKDVVKTIPYIRIKKNVIRRINVAEGRKIFFQSLLLRICCWCAK